MKISIIQPTVPVYRDGFFGRLANRLGPSFCVYASPGNLGVLTTREERPAWEQPLGPMRTIAPGVFWQTGALSVPIAPGDVVVVSGAPRCLSNIAILIKAKAAGAKTIWWGHYWSSTSRWWRAFLRIAMMQYADAILFYTDMEVNECTSANRVRIPLSALNNGIETGEISRLRRPYDPDQRPRDLVFIGRLTRKAEVYLLIAALALPSCKNLTLDVVGTGEEEQSLRNSANELGVTDRIEWHGGTTDELRIAGIANNCKLFVYPGSVGLSLIHGLSYGLPAIVHDTRRKQEPEIAALRPGDNGELFIQGNAASLAKTIVTMLSEPRQLIRMSLAATETTRDTFNTSDMTERFLAAVTAVSKST